jgi:type II secretory pathway predicted ATPase ExeA
VGTGKTTVINRLLYWLHEQHMPTAFIFSSLSEPSHLFDFMLAGFGVPFDPQAKGSCLVHLNEWLLQRYSAGKIPVLIVDEAQGLPINVLEEIRMLLNLETQQEKLLQIVLCGQPELEEKLSQPDLRQFKQRINVRCKTEALTLQETHAYVQARLNIAGAHGNPMFEFQAINAVYLYSRGIPRVVNLLCEHALINTYADGVHLISAHVVEEIAHEFQFDKEPLVPCIDLLPAESTDWIGKQSVIKAETAPSRIVVPEPTDLKTTHSAEEGCRRLAAHILGKGALHHPGIGGVSPAQSRVSRMYVSFFHPAFEQLQSARQEVERAWQRMKRYLIRWLRQPLVHRKPLSTRTQNRSGAIVWAVTAISRQSLGMWHRWQEIYPSLIRSTNRLKRTEILLRWLQRPYRPFPLRSPTPREMGQRSRESSA